MPTLVQVGLGKWGLDWVQCRTWNPSWSDYLDPPEASAIIDFEDGIAVNYRGSRLHPGRPTFWGGEWLMYFEQGSVMWKSRGNHFDMRSAADDSLSIYRSDTAPVQVTLPDLEFMDRAGTLDAFARALASGTNPESSGAENLGSLALAHSAIKSADRREPIPVISPAGRPSSG